MKHLLLLAMLAVSITARAVTGTVYVKAETAPYLYAWYTVGGAVEQPLGYWPGTLMTDTEVVKSVPFWKMTVSSPDEVAAFNIIFNNGVGGQTADIIGLSSDRYYEYDGYTGYTDITDEYLSVPNAEITQVEIQGDFSGLMAKGEGYVYTMDIDLSGSTADQLFKFVVNGSVNTDIESRMTIEAPENWVEVQENYCVLRHSITDYKSYRLTATWVANPNALDGWTLKVEGKDYRYELIDTEEWQLLMAWYAQTGQGAGWTRPWNFAVATPSVKTLPGVSAADGHVTAIDLSENNMTGTFPFALLALPQLKTLNVKWNQLTGDIGIGMAAFSQMYPNVAVNVENIYASFNQLSGNVGLFAHFCPNLKQLQMRDNHLRDLYPAIDKNVSLRLLFQTIDETVTLNLNTMTVEEIAQTIPTIILYDHEAQDWNSPISLACDNADATWQAMLYYANGNVGMTVRTGYNTYRGKSGDTLYVTSTAGNVAQGSIFSIKYEFADGDANMNGPVDVLDLQTIIRYIFNQYKTLPFNFTAANLWEDEQINVQDVVRMVTLLLAQTAEQQQAPRRVAGSGNTTDAAATVYCSGGQLYVSADQPVAAFDVTICNAGQVRPLASLRQAGMELSMKTQADGSVRLIGYSLSGATLPVGETAIAAVSSHDAAVSRAQLSSEDAQEIGAVLNSMPTGIATCPQPSRRGAEEVYRISTGRSHAISIDSKGNKTAK